MSPSQLCHLPAGSPEPNQPPSLGWPGGLVRLHGAVTLAWPEALTCKPGCPLSAHCRLQSFKHTLGFLLQKSLAGEESRQISFFLCPILEGNHKKRQTIVSDTSQGSGDRGWGGNGPEGRGRRVPSYLKDRPTGLALDTSAAGDSLLREHLKMKLPFFCTRAEFFRI